MIQFSVWITTRDLLTHKIPNSGYLNIGLGRYRSGKRKPKIRKYQVTQRFGLALDTPRKTAGSHSQQMDVVDRCSAGPKDLPTMATSMRSKTAHKELPVMHGGSQEEISSTQEKKLSPKVGGPDLSQTRLIQTEKNRHDSPTKLPES